MVQQMALILFSWGYWGWGNATEQLIVATGIAERARGFEPPVFADCRIRRKVRAKGFLNDAFRELLAKADSQSCRYYWMDDLGNDAVAKGQEGVVIKNEGAIECLLDLATEEAKQRRRVIFYCACEFPRLDGKLTCHRVTIADLLLNHARKNGPNLSVVEWPGGEPITTRLEVDRKLFSAVMHGRKSIPFEADRLQDFAGMPWGSILSLASDDGKSTADVLVGPAKFTTFGDGYWYLPVIEPPDADTSRESLRERAAQWREAHGLNERESRQASAKDG
jgi:hypothetical protein